MTSPADAAQSDPCPTSPPLPLVAGSGGGGEVSAGVAGDGELVRARLDAVLRDERLRVLATVTRLVGDWQLAEDSVQDATLAALTTWPRDGIPEHPRAWLVTVARRRAIDIIRREAARPTKEEAAMDPAAAADASPWGAAEPRDDWSSDPDLVDDDVLRLVFTCCHPSLAPDAQVALSLRTLCGLTTAEVARALLVPEETMRKRLTRIKLKIAAAGIPYRVPSAPDLPDRVAGVAACVYLMFNEGYSATSGQDPVRVDLVDEAIRLGRLLLHLMPDEAGLAGLLGLMLLQDSRRATRIDGSGAIVLLADQDRSQWRRAAIEEGVVLVGRGLRRTPEHPDPYVIQGAIAACHALAPTAAATDWAAIVSWYDVLLTVSDGPVVRLNRAVALAERDGPEAGLAEIDAQHMSAYPLWHASRGELLARLGRSVEAVAALDAALALETNEATRAHVLARRHQIAVEG